MQRRYGCDRILRVVAFGVLVPWMTSAVEIVAHRGASHDAPENTLPAVLLGWERGADAVEIDIHQTSDGRIVAIHDKDTLRVTGRPGLVAEATLSRLRQLDAGVWKGRRWEGTRIPTLEEVLATVPRAKTLVVEIKCSRTVIPELESVLRASPKGDQVMLIAFDYETIAEAKRRMPYLRSYWLYGFSDREAERYQVNTPEDLLVRVQRAGLDGLDVRHDGVWVAELTESLRGAGKGMYVYTVNDPEQGLRLRELGVTGITTDRPAYLREAMNRD